MLELVNTIVDSAADIVAHNLAGASAKVENAMAKVVPIAIGFLAGVIGIGNLSKKVGDIIDRVKVPITKAIDWVVDKAVAFADKLGITKMIEKGTKWVQDKVAKITDKVMSLLGLKKKFKSDAGETHTLYFDTKGQDVELMVASNPKPYTEFLELAEKNIPEAKKEYLNKAKVIADNIDKTKRQPVTGSNDAETEKAKKDKQDAIDGFLKELAEVTKHLFGNADEKSDPVKLDTYDTKDGIFGEHMRIAKLTKNHDPGSVPNTDPHTTYDIINRRKYPGGASYYVRGHLLNEHLGGLGEWNNLVPLTRTANSEHESKVESIVKAGVNSGAIMKYTVTAVYGRSPRTTENESLKEIMMAEQHVPGVLHCSVAYLTNEDGVWKENKIENWAIKNEIGTAESSYYLEDSKPHPEIRLYNAASEDIAKIVNENGDRIISTTLAEEIEAAYSRLRENKDRKQFASYLDLANSIPNISARNAQNIINLASLNYVKLK
ncbi:MAG: DNA/RNA non-specific endonuclease [Bacteroidetes bacterium]|nr:DNA/RNA non-specific endonuclease [Bacteroidota bacterium]